MRNFNKLIFMVVLTGFSSVADPETIAVYPWGMNDGAKRVMATFAEQLEQEIREVDPGKNDSWVMQLPLLDRLHVVRTSGNTVLSQESSFATAMKFSGYVGIIQHRSASVNLRSEFYLKEKISAAVRPVLHSTSLTLQGPTNVRTAASAIAQHKLVIWYILAREAFRIKRPNPETLYYVQLAQEQMPKPVPENLNVVAADLALIRSSILGRSK